MSYRSRADIETGLRAAQIELSRDPSDAFTRGAVVAYQWILGLRPVAPSSEAMLPVNERTLLSEEEYARRAIYSSSGSVRSYNVGVENALMWCRSATDGAPVPLSMAA
jgi:hypothetical protein